MIWLYDEEEPQLILERNLSKKLLAFFFACFFYLLLLIFLFVEILVIQKSTESLIPRGNDLLDNLPRRAAPARVVNVPRRLLHQQSTPTIAAPHGTKKAPVSEKIIAPQKAIPVADALPAIKTALPSSEKIPVNVIRKGNIIPQPSDEIAPNKSIEKPLPSRRGRSSWVKNEERSVPTEVFRSEDTKQAQIKDPGNTYSSPFSDFSDISQNAAKEIFFENNDGEAGENPSFGIPSGNPSATEQSKRFEMELFMTRFVRNICDTSQQNPLKLNKERIPKHLITVMITIGRGRHIEAFSFTQHSPYPLVDNYIKEIINTTMPPKIPESWESDVLKIPLHIYIYSTPETSEIWLVPHERK